MDKASKQKGETKKMPPVYSEEKLKALETAANWIRNQQVFFIQQIQKNDISDKKLQEIGHFDKRKIKLYKGEPKVSVTLTFHLFFMHWSNYPPIWMSPSDYQSFIYFRAVSHKKKSI